VHAVVPDLPVLLCTGYRQPLPAERAAAVGIQAVLLKPTAKQVLAQTIRRILDARSRSDGPLSPRTRRGQGGRSGSGTP
jgi:CheY-like chemotaxis protein